MCNRSLRVPLAKRLCCSTEPIHPAVRLRACDDDGARLHATIESQVLPTLTRDSRGQFAKSLSSAEQAAKLLDKTAADLRSRASNPRANKQINSNREVCARNGWGGRSSTMQWCLKDRDEPAPSLTHACMYTRCILRMQGDRIEKLTSAIPPLHKLVLEATAKLEGRDSALQASKGSLSCVWLCRYTYLASYY